MRKKTLYQNIIDFYKDKIHSGELQVGEKLPTEMQISEIFSVSRITAKRALEELCNEGYIYRKKGQGSFVQKKSYEEKTFKHNIVSIIIPDENTKDGLLDYIRGASDFLSSKGFFLTVQNTGGDSRRERELLLRLPKEGIRGIIYYPKISSYTFDILNTLTSSNYPLVTIDKYYSHIQLSYVVSDNYNGEFETTLWLIENGYKNIAFVSNVSIEPTSSVRDRFLGYSNALKYKDIPIDNSIILNNLWDETSKMPNEEERFEYIKNICDNFLKKGVNAIICENDYVAITIHNALVSLGVRVGEDVIIVGFDNIGLLQGLNVNITTLEQDFYSIGKNAAEILYNDILKEKNTFKKVVLPVKRITHENYF